MRRTSLREVVDLALGDLAALDIRRDKLGVRSVGVSLLLWGRVGHVWIKGCGWRRDAVRSFRRES
jgi:hypothetical protein